MVRALLDGSKTQTRLALREQPPEEARHYVYRVGTYSGIAEPRHYWGSHESFEAAYDADDDMELWPDDDQDGVYGPGGLESPYGSEKNYIKQADRLWVRENGWERPERTAKMMREGADTWEPYYFDADGLTEQDVADFKAWGFKRRPSIHMPRAHSRIMLEITGVRVERLQDISAGDALAEGFKINIDKATKEPLMRISGKFPPAQYIKGNGLVIAEYASLWETLNGPGSWALNPWVWVIEFKRIEE